MKVLQRINTKFLFQLLGKIINSFAKCLLRMVIQPNDQTFLIVFQTTSQK